MQILAVILTGCFLFAIPQTFQLLNFLMLCYLFTFLCRNIGFIVSFYAKLLRQKNISSEENVHISKESLTQICKISRGINMISVYVRNVTCS